MDVKRKAMKIFSSEEQPMILRCPPEKISNLLQIGGGGGGDEENSPPDAPIPHRAIANRRRECRLRNDNK